MKTKYWIGLFAGLLLLSATAALLLSRSGGARAEIWSDGTLLYTVDLSRDQTFTVESAEGSNTVTVQDGTIAVTAATCPDQICVRRGHCAGGAPIICLPNRLVIRFVGEAQTDATVG
ncbi:MAG: NusG domain II-containing protein [Oscillospiraceae bacterium]|nr:NusG domain II-containing protein [Oscillospiraceae bacterium]